MLTFAAPLEGPLNLAALASLGVLSEISDKLIAIERTGSHSGWSLVT
jgi:hypothetical protein